VQPFHYGSVPQNFKKINRKKQSLRIRAGQPPEAVRFGTVAEKLQALLTFLERALFFNVIMTPVKGKPGKGAVR